MDEDQAVEKLMDAIRPPANDSQSEVEAAAYRIEMKVQGGTPFHGNSLCSTCHNAHRIQGMAVSEETVFCNANGHSKKIPYPISKCSEYSDERLPTLYEMREIAWQIVTKSNRTIGFVSAKEFKKMKYEMEDDDERPR